MSFSLFLTGVLIAFLLAGLVYVLTLEHRLIKIKESHKKLSLLMDQFYKATQKAQEELLKLKNYEEQARKDLKLTLDKATLIRDEIAFLNEKHTPAPPAEKTYHYDQPLDPVIPLFTTPIEKETPKISSDTRSQAEKDLSELLERLKP